MLLKDQPDPMLDPSKTCDDCDVDPKPALVYCKLCDQYLCLQCDTRIHNKGKRAQHERSSLIKSVNKTKCLDLLSDERQELAVDKIFYNDSLLITYAQPLQINKTDGTDPHLEVLIRHMYDLYLKSAREGVLMHELSDFKKELFKSVSTELKTINKQELQYLFKRIEQLGLIHITKRKFGDSKTIIYASL